MLRTGPLAGGGRPAEPTDPRSAAERDPASGAVRHLSARATEDQRGRSLARAGSPAADPGDARCLRRGGSSRARRVTLVPRVADHSGSCLVDRNRGRQGSARYRRSGRRAGGGDRELARLRDGVRHRDHERLPTVGTPAHRSRGYGGQPLGRAGSLPPWSADPLPVARWHDRGDRDVTNCSDPSRRCAGGNPARGSARRRALGWRIALRAWPE